jgi:hypothetical protein
MPKEWYISFHGGDEKTSLNNIHVYSTDGKKLRKALNKKSIPQGITLRELRGFAFGPDKESVVNAYFEYSEVLKFNGALNGWAARLCRCFCKPRGLEPWDRSSL